jgi:hypothetical protein
VTADSNSNDDVNVNVPVGVVAMGALLAAGAALAYILLGRGSESATPDPGRVAKSGRGLMRRAGILTLITLIENDATRKVVVALLRAMARRA